MIALLLGGWVAACGTGLAAGGLWRVLGWRMETVARACHELRGPLTAARLGLELGTRTGELSPERLRAIDLELGRAALALEELDTARDRRTITRRASGPVDLVELVYDSAEALRPWAVSRGVELRIVWRGAQPAVVVGERLRLAQAIGNLIANAIEHGGDVVEVFGRIEREVARVEVVDGGPGLPAPVDELVRRARRGRGRRGRGLAVAQAVVTGHGGSLAVARSERGARLVVVLPLVPSPVGVDARPSVMRRRIRCATVVDPPPCATHDHAGSAGSATARDVARASSAPATDAPLSGGEKPATRAPLFGERPFTRP